MILTERAWWKNKKYKLYRRYEVRDENILGRNFEGPQGTAWVFRLSASCSTSPPLLPPFPNPSPENWDKNSAPGTSPLPLSPPPIPPYYNPHKTGGKRSPQPQFSLEIFFRLFLSFYAFSFSLSLSLLIYLIYIFLYVLNIYRTAMPKCNYLLIYYKFWISVV